MTGIITRYFSDKTKSEWIPSIAAWLGISFALLCICLTPVDIYATSLTQSLTQAKSPIFSTIKLLYMGSLHLLCRFENGACASVLPRLTLTSFSLLLCV